MSPNDRRREDRAFEALIVSQLRRERDLTNHKDLPELTEEERAAMSAVPANLIDRLWDAVDEQDVNPPAEDSDWEAAVDEGAYAGMNRADEPTDETNRKLDEARQEVLDELKRKRKDGKDAQS